MYTFAKENTLNYTQTPNMTSGNIPADLNIVIQEYTLDYARTLDNGKGGYLN